jgi:hypothetical protein
MRYSNLLPRLALLALVVPLAGFCASFQISGTGTGATCFGTCPDPNSTSTAAGISPASGTVSGNYTATYTLADGDKYAITAAFNASYTTGIAIVFNPTVTYVGSTPAAAADSISLDLYQNFYDTTGTTWNSPPNYCEYFPATVAAGGSATAALSYDGNSIGTLSAGPGTSSQFKCSALSFSAAQNASAYLNADYNVTFNFAAGTTTGTSESSISATSVPEPSTMALGMLGSGSLLYFARRRRAA